MKWFENAGIALVRAANILVFLAILLAGLLFGLGTNEPVLLVLAALAAFLIGGLVTGAISMMCQMHASLKEQTELLRAIANAAQDSSKSK